MQINFLRACLPLAGTALLGSCVTTYVPTVPSTPLLNRGQVEITAGLRGIQNAEVGAAWSPLPHVLLTGEVAAAISPQETTYTDPQGGTNTTYTDSHRQGGVGLGLYQTAPGRSYLALMGGIGWGHTNFFAQDDYAVASPFFPLPVPTRQGVYDARYRRYYGQVYLASPEAERGPRFGASFRTVWLDYTHFTYADQPVIVPQTRVLVEPSVFVRFGRGALRYFATAGLSLPLTTNHANPYDKRVASQSYLFSGGIIFRPDLLKHRRK
ncbi:MAG: hypothetical protein M3Y54_13730 [Bacteroidota bacterium]|nr:hypothetical protein [Bacteroidota bacterium]